MATPVPPISSHHEAAVSLTDALLEEIFLRIACPADLARASAACVAFRRLVTDPAFLRRYRSRGPPLLLGFFTYEASEGFHPVEAPHPNAPAARALANISFDYLPPPRLEDWYISDVRDGRVLLGCVRRVDGAATVTGLAVCDPSSVSRRYLLLPPVDIDQVEPDLRYFDAVFDPCAARGKDDETSFRVIGILVYVKKLVVLVFDRATGNWIVRTSGSFDALLDCQRAFLWRPGYACGSFYWKVAEQNKLLKLDVNTMEFSRVDLPPGHDAHVVVAEAGEGMLGMFSYTPSNDGKFLNCYRSMQGQRTNEWQMSSIPLPDHDDFQIVGAPEGYVFIHGFSKVQDKQHTTIYSLDINTLKFEMATRISCYFHGIPYFSFPPTISPTRI